MPPKDDKKKDAGRSAKKDKDLVSKSGGKAKKKWSKGMVRGTLNDLVLCNKATYNKLSYVLNSKLRTPAVVSERRFEVPRPGQPFRISLVKDLLNWFQSTELESFTPVTPRAQMPRGWRRCTHKSHRRCLPKKKTLLN